MTPKAIGRLENWKFTEALHALNPDDPHARVIAALSTIFGNVGWMGDDSAMGTLIDFIVSTIIADQPHP